MREFKYKTTFVSDATVYLGKIAQANKREQLLASASLDDLKKLLPSDEEIEENPDLLYTAFDAAVINLINMNGHGMATDTALGMAKYFKNKHMNIEHDRYSVIGHIINYGFSTFADSKIIEDPESLRGSLEPFNLSLAAIVYRVVNEWIAGMIEDSVNPEDPCMYQQISASWEVGYDEYDIVLGSRKIADAEIITDENKQGELAEHLLINGGDGFLSDGTPCYTLISGEALPLGCAFTFRPAAAVKGLTIAKKTDDSEDNHDDPIIVVSKIDEAVNKITKAFDEKVKKIEEKSEQNQKTTVIGNMKITAIEDITSEFLKEAKASDVTAFIRDELKKTGTEFTEKLDTEKEARAQAEASLEEVKDTKERLEQEVSSLKEEIEGLKDTIAQKERDETFASRMTEITSAYELDNKQKEAVANQIRDLGDDEFKAWKSQFELFAMKKEDKPKGKEDKAAKALTNSSPDKPTVLVGGSNGEDSPFQNVLSKFKESIKLEDR